MPPAVDATRSARLDSTASSTASRSSADCSTTPLKLSRPKNQAVGGAVPPLVEQDQSSDRSETPQEPLDLRQLPHQVDRIGPVGQEDHVPVAASHHLICHPRAIGCEGEGSARLPHRHATTVANLVAEHIQLWVRGDADACSAHLMGSAGHSWHPESASRRLSSTAASPPCCPWGRAGYEILWPMAEKTVVSRTSTPRPSWCTRPSPTSPAWASGPRSVTRCEWHEGFDGPVVGATFDGHNRNGDLTWTTQGKVIEAEPGRAFTFECSMMEFHYSTWGYRDRADRRGLPSHRVERGSAPRVRPGVQQAGLGDRRPGATQSSDDEPDARAPRGNPRGPGVVGR